MGVTGTAIFLILIPLCAALTGAHLMAFRSSLRERIIGGVLLLGTAIYFLLLNRDIDLDLP
jgi:hypothetical protein